MDTKTLEKVLSILRRQVKKYNLPIVTKISNEKRDPFKILISTMLSLRTKDTITAQASKSLFENADTPEKILNLTANKIEQLIYPVGFYKTKARNIRKVCKIIISRYSGKVPDKMEELLELPGVGRKTANLVLTLGYNKLGICVDTHVHRISNRFGYVTTKSPEETEFALRKKLPKKYWIEYNDILVSYGQNVCTPINPKCNICKVNCYCERVNVATKYFANEKH